MRRPTIDKKLDSLGTRPLNAEFGGGSHAELGIGLVDHDSHAAKLSSGTSKRKQAEMEPTRRGDVDLDLGGMSQRCWHDLKCFLGGFESGLLRSGTKL